MKKALPYILIAIVLFLGAGFYLQSTKKDGALLPVGIKSESDKKLNELKPSDLFKNYGPAPELAGIQSWLNSEPLTLANLKGKVVLIDFWTYSCINCIRTLPYVTTWYDTYKDDGFVVIGVHTPEFAFEKESSNVQSAIDKYKIHYPVALDNSYGTWSAFKNQYWPASYLIDKDGNVVYTHFGEGNYDITETAIRTLLGKDTAFDAPKAPEVNQAQTPEIYFGLSRQEAYDGSTKPSTSEQTYTFPNQTKGNHFSLEGKWIINDEVATSSQPGAKVRLSFDSAKVFMVAKSENTNTIKIFIDGKFLKEVSVNGSDLYELYSSASGGKHLMEIEIPQSGFEAFTFTFG